MNDFKKYEPVVGDKVEHSEGMVKVKLEVKNIQPNGDVQLNYRKSEDVYGFGRINEFLKSTDRDGKELIIWNSDNL